MPCRQQSGVQVKEESKNPTKRPTNLAIQIQCGISTIEKYCFLLPSICRSAVALNSEWKEREAHSKRVGVLHVLKGFELFEQVLVHDQHRPTLDAGPHSSWTDASEPSCDALRLVNHLQTRKERRGVQSHSPGWRRRCHRC